MLVSLLIKLYLIDLRNIVQVQTSCTDELFCLSMSSRIGLVGRNVAVDMALTNPAMNQNGATGERGTKSVITTCAAGAKRDAVSVLKEIVEDQETVQR